MMNYNPSLKSFNQVRDDISVDMSVGGEAGWQLTFQLCLLVIVLLEKEPYTHKYLAATQRRFHLCPPHSKQARVPAGVAGQAGD